MPKYIYSKQKIFKYKFEILSATIPFLIHVVLLVWGVFVSNKFLEFNFITIWNRWDAIHYINIAQYGYNPQHLSIETIQFMSRFPPLYPLFLNVASQIFFQSYITSALLLSTFFTCTASVYLYKLTFYEYKKKSTALWSVIFLNIFPLSYFLLAPYSESLYLLLVLMYFYYSRVKKSYLLPSVLYSLSLITRVFGVFMYPVHLYFYIQAIKNKEKSFKSYLYNTILLILPGITFLIYQFYLSLNKHAFGYLNSTDASSIKIGIPFYELYSSFDRIITDPLVLLDSSFMYTIGFTAVFMFFVFAIFVLGFNKLHKSYILYIFFFLVFVGSLRWVISGPRFVLICFPIFMLLSQITKNWQKILLSVVFMVFLLIFSYRYLIGWWAF